MQRSSYTLVVLNNQCSIDHINLNCTVWQKWRLAKRSRLLVPTLRRFERCRAEYEDNLVKFITETCCGVQLIGSAEFIQRTMIALEIARNTTLFKEVMPYLAVIEQSHRTRVKVHSRTPTFKVGERTWKSQSVWYASGIIHEACHSVLYYSNNIKFIFINCTIFTAWVGVEAERKCCRMQLKALEEMNADLYLIDHIKKSIEFPFHMLIINNGW